jgi:hypothetical protein
MIAVELQQEVLRLHAFGMSGRKIAKTLPVSRNAVRDILARGHVRMPRPRYELAQATVWGYCPECGVKVTLPCIACRARAALELEQKRRRKEMRHRELQPAS